MSNVILYFGRVASTPVLTRPSGNTVCKFTLLRNEYTGEDDQGVARPERVVSVQFTAFGSKAENISKYVLEGDQLLIEARLENNNFTKDGKEEYGFNFIVSSFEFGAPGQKKRAQLDQANNTNNS